MPATSSSPPAMPRNRSTCIPLEGKLTDDDAWCDCDVSIGSSGQKAILNIQFSGVENTDSICSANEARSRLRVRSKILENAQCLQLQEAETVLASRKLESGKTHFFDALIKNIQRRKHSARVSCKCMFEVIWLDTKMKGNTCTVPASQIRQLMQLDIQDHPVVWEWLKSVKQEDDQPDPSDMGREVEAQLEEEISRITMMAESFDKNHFVDEFATKPSAEAADVEQSNQKVRVPRQKSRAKGKLENIPGVAHPQKSSRKWAQSSTTTVLEDESERPAAPPFDKRPRLSPLAARAALAAAVHPSRSASPVAFAKPQETEKKTHSARKQLDSSSLAVDDENKMSISINVSSGLSLPERNHVYPFKGSPFPSHWEMSEIKNGNRFTGVSSSNTFNDKLLRERTNHSSKEDEPSTVVHLKDRQKGAASSVRSSARIRKNANISTLSQSELNKKMHKTALEAGSEIADGPSSKKMASELKKHINVTNGSRKEQFRRTPHAIKKVKIAEHDTQQSAKIEQLHLHEELSAAIGDVHEDGTVTVELFGDELDDGQEGPLDALPVGYGVGVRGWLPPPGQLQRQQSQSPSEVHEESGNLHAPEMNQALTTNTQKRKKAGKKKAASPSLRMDADVDARLDEACTQKFPGSSYIPDRADDDKQQLSQECLQSAESGSVCVYLEDDCAKPLVISVNQGKPPVVKSRSGRRTNQSLA